MSGLFLHTMYKQTCANLLALPKQRVRQWINTFDAALFDVDGVLWVLQKPLEGVSEVLNTLKAMGKRVFIVSNNTVVSRQHMTQVANDVGILITRDEIITSATATISYLRHLNFKKKVYLIGEGGIAGELDEAGIKYTPIGPDVVESPIKEYANKFKYDEEIGAVIVAQDQHFSIAKLFKAASYLLDPKCLFLATNRDPAFPINERMVLPGAGPVVAAVKAVSRRKPLTLGKPNPFLVGELLKCGVIKPETTLMVGDTLQTDILLGFNCGFQTMLVGTGLSTLDDVRRAQESDDPKKCKLVPDVYLPKLSDLQQFLPAKACHT